MFITLWTSLLLFATQCTNTQHTILTRPFFASRATVDTYTGALRTPTRARKGWGGACDTEDIGGSELLIICSHELSERPFPWGGRRGKNLSSLRHIASTVASALGICHRQVTHHHSDNHYIARRVSHTTIHLQCTKRSTRTATAWQPICRSAHMCTATCISPRSQP